MANKIEIHVRTIEFIVGEGWKKLDTPTLIDVDAITYVEAQAFVHPEEGINDHNLKLSFNNGTLAVVTQENGVTVLSDIVAARPDSLAHKFVQVTHHERMLCESRTGIGWTTKKAPEIVKVPDFLKRYAS